jgi:hypothetical protein
LIEADANGVVSNDANRVEADFQAPSNRRPPRLRIGGVWLCGASTRLNIWPNQIRPRAQHLTELDERVPSSPSASRMRTAC